MASDDGSCVGFMPKPSNSSSCLKCSQRKEDHVSLFISPIMPGRGSAHQPTTPTKSQTTNVLTESNEHAVSTPSKESQAKDQIETGFKQKARKSTPPPRPKTLPNYNKLKSTGNVQNQKPKMLRPRSIPLNPTPNQKAAPVTSPQKPKRSPSHKTKYLAHKKLDTPLLPNRNSKTSQEDLSKNIATTENQQKMNYEESEENVSRRSRSSSRSRKKRRAPTPVRRSDDGSECLERVSNDGNNTSTSASGSNVNLAKDVKLHIETSQIEQMLKRKLTTINAQLHYINNASSNKNDDQRTLDCKIFDESVSAADDDLIINADDTVAELEASPDKSDDLVAVGEKTIPSETANSSTITGHVRFIEEVVIINHYIDLQSLSDNDSDGSESGAVEASLGTCSEDEDDDDDTMTVEQEVDIKFDVPSSSESESENLVDDFSEIAEEVSKEAAETHSADEAETSSLVHEPTRTSRARERFRKKEQAPTPPSVTAPALKNIALRLDSRNYNYNMSKADGREELSADPPQRTLRSKSVDRSFEKSRKKMPPAKNFFKTLLRKGKSKQDMAAPEFEAVSPSDTEDHGIENDEVLQVEGKLPKEFLDTWVSSTTNQLMDEMDQALKGVWPYDKKEDTSSYRRKSTSHADIIESLTDESQTTMKRRSKPQVPSSAWSEKGGSDTVSSNFILKERTKKTSPNTSNGTLRSLRSQYASQPSLHHPAQQKAGKKSRSPSKERRSSRDMTVTESDGSIPKTKFREQFLQKMQREGHMGVGKEYRDNKSLSNPESSGSSGTLLKKKNKSSEISKSNSQTWDNKSQISSILKNGSGSNTPNGSVSKSKKVPPVASHGRQSSVPSSTYSGSSSGHSAESRTKDELTEGKISPSNSNPHDSGYESGTVRSRRDVIAQVHHQHTGYESATLSRGKKDVPRESSFESGTMKPRKEMASNADFATLKRVKRSPTLSLTSRSTPRGASTAIDSIPLCFEQLTAMNVSTLQQLCSTYVQSQKPVSTPEVTPKWHDIGLMDELQPIFSSTKLVLYKGYWRNNPSDVFTVMLSLREPAKCQNFKPNLLRTSVTFEANVANHLIPASLYAGKKLMQKTAASTVEPAPKESQPLIPNHSRNMSTPALNTQLSVDDSLLCAKIPQAQPKEVLQHPIRLSQVSSVETESEPNRDSVFTEQTSRDSVASMASIQEQAAVDSILLAVAGEDEPEIPDIPDTPDQPAQLPSIKKAEPVKLTNKVETYNSAVKAPVAERFTSSRTAELFNNTSTNNNKYNRIIPGLKTSGLVKNRIASLNNNNSNNCDDDEGSDCEFDFQSLNSNNNNNLDEMPTGAGADFSVASHLLEMAGGEFHEPQAEIRENIGASPDRTPRGAAGLSICQDKVSYSQSVTCFVTILPTLPKVESIKTYLDRVKSENRTKEDLEMDVIFILLQILNIIFGLHENQLRLDSISMTDFLVVTDAANVSTVHCHMINATQSPNQKIGLTCEKLRMFLMQISHSTESLQKSVIFTTVDDMIQNAEDLGDLKTIAAILQYLLWGPKEEEVKVITLAEHRRQAFELWLQLARGKLVSSLAVQPIDNLKAHMVTSFLANTNGSELFKITKLLNTY